MDLELNARKLKLMYTDEMQQVILSGGVCPGLLWLQVAIWSEALPSDTGYIEGINNMIISAFSQAPTMKLPLGSSRIVGRCALLKAGVNHCSVRHMVAPMNDMVGKATDSFSLAQAILSDVDRFTTPPPISDEIKPSRSISPSQFSPTVMQWARHYNAMWIKHVRKHDFPLRCLLVLQNGDGQTMTYLTPHVHGYSGHLLICEVTEVASGRKIDVRRPLAYKRSEHAFAEMFVCKELALPFCSWGVSPDTSALLDESIIGRLEPWQPPHERRRVTRLAIADVSVSDEQPTEDDNLDIGAEAESDADRLDYETGVCEPEELSQGERDLLTPGVAKLVEDKLDGIDAAEAFHDPNSLLKDALESVVAEFGSFVLVADELLTVEACETALRVWSPSLRLSLQAAHEVALQPSAKIPPANRNASLLLHQEADAYIVKFVHWVRGATSRSLKGRTVMTENGKFVCSVATWFPITDFNASPPTIIMADVGARMLKVRKPERPAVPRTSLRMKEMCEIAVGRKVLLDPCALAAGEVAPSVSGVSPCFICTQGTFPLLTCAVCVMTYHETCCDTLVEIVRDRSAITREVAGLDPVRLQSLFRGTACSICMEAGLVQFE